MFGSIDMLSFDFGSSIVFTDCDVCINKIKSNRIVLIEISISRESRPLSVLTHERAGDLQLHIFNTTGVVDCVANKKAVPKRCRYQREDQMKGQRK